MAPQLKRPSQREIARLAGVSQAAVSKALRGEADLGERTRRQILSVAKQLGYRPNRLMPGIFAGRTRMLGTFLTGFGRPFFYDLLHGIERGAFEHNHSVIPKQAVVSADTDEYEVNVLLETRVDGLLVSPRLSEANQRFYADLLGKGEKIVFINQQMPAVHACCIYSDDLDGSRAAVEHLLEHGHRKVAYVSNAVVTDTTNMYRERGYRETLSAHEIPEMDRWVLDTRQELVTTLADLLAAEPDLSAFFCFNDGVALDLIDGLEALGRKVPDDVSIVGYGDNIAHPRHLKVPLTTISQDGEAMGREAVTLLLRLLDGETSVVGDHVQPVHLVQRESVRSATS